MEARIATVPEDERPSALILWKYSDGVPQVSGNGTFGTYWMKHLGVTDVAAEAKARGVTRAIVSMERAAQLPKPCIFAIGNAPTALVSLEALMEADKLHPALIIGVPVGFVNVIESKELVIANCRAPYIVARGRKGGSNVAAAICNAMLYQIRR